MALDVMNSRHVENLIQEIEDCSMRGGGIIPPRENFNLPRPSTQGPGKLDSTPGKEPN
jgi:hypothetical protein